MDDTDILNSVNWTTNSIDNWLADDSDIWKSDDWTTDKIDD